MKAKLILAMIIVGLGMLSARAQIFVLNGGFETGDLTGWAVTPASTGSAFGVDHGPGCYPDWAPHSGSHYFGFGAVDGLYDTLSQTVATTPGAAYHVNLWILNPQPESDLLVKWAGTTLLHITSSDTSPAYENYDVIATASETSTLIEIAGLNAPCTIAIDDVSVTPVPEPLGCTLASSVGLMGLVLWRRFSGRKQPAGMQ